MYPVYLTVTKLLLMSCVSSVSETGADTQCIWCIWGPQPVYLPSRVPQASVGQLGLAGVGVAAGPLRPAAHASRAVCLGGRESRWDRAVGSWGAL